MYNIVNVKNEVRNQIKELNLASRYQTREEGFLIHLI